MRRITTGTNVYAKSNEDIFIVRRVSFLYNRIYAHPVSPER